MPDTNDPQTIIQNVVLALSETVKNQGVVIRALTGADRAAKSAEHSLANYSKVVSAVDKQWKHAYNAGKSFALILKGTTKAISVGMGAAAGAAIGSVEQLGDSLLAASVASRESASAIARLRQSYDSLGGSALSTVVSLRQLGDEVAKFQKRGLAFRAVADTSEFQEGVGGLIDTLSRVVGSRGATDLLDNLIQSYEGRFDTLKHLLTGEFVELSKTIAQQRKNLLMGGAEGDIARNTMQDALQRQIELLSNMELVAGDAAGNIRDLINTLQLSLRQLEGDLDPAIAATMRWNEITANMRKVFHDVQKTILDVFGQDIVNSIQQITNYIQSDASDALSRFRDILIDLAPTIRSAFGIVWDVLKGLLNSVPSLVDAVNNSMNVIKSSWETVSSVVSGVITYASPFFSFLWDAIQTSASAISSMFDSLPKSIQDVLKSLASIGVAGAAAWAFIPGVGTALKGIGLAMKSIAGGLGFGQFGKSLLSTIGLARDQACSMQECFADTVDSRLRRSRRRHGRPTRARRAATRRAARIKARNARVQARLERLKERAVTRRARKMARGRFSRRIGRYGTQAGRTASRLIGGGQVGRFLPRAAAGVGVGAAGLAASAAATGLGIAGGLAGDWLGGFASDLAGANENTKELASAMGGVAGSAAAVALAFGPVGAAISASVTGAFYLADAYMQTAAAANSAREALQHNIQGYDLLIARAREMGETAETAFEQAKAKVSEFQAEVAKADAEAEQVKFDSWFYRTFAVELFVDDTQLENARKRQEEFTSKLVAARAEKQRVEEVLIKWKVDKDISIPDEWKRVGDEIRSQIKSAQDKISSDLPTEDLKQYQSQLDEALSRLKEFARLQGLLQSKKEIEYKIKTRQAEMSIESDPKALARLQSGIETLEASLKEINKQMGGTDISKLLKPTAELTESAGKVASSFDEAAESIKKLNDKASLIQNINDSIAKLNQELIETSKNMSLATSAVDSLEGLMDQFSEMGTIGGRALADLLSQSADAVRNELSDSFEQAQQAASLLSQQEESRNKALQEANSARIRGDEAEAAKKTAEAEALGVSILQTRADLLDKINTQQAAREKLVKALTINEQEAKSRNELMLDVFERQLEISRNLYGTPALAVEAQLNIVHALEQQVALTEQQIRNLDEEIARLTEIAKAAGDPDKREEAEQSIYKLMKERVRLHGESLSLQSKQVSQLRELRDGYLDAVQAQAFGAGKFEKIIVTQEKNTAIALEKGIAKANFLVGQIGEAARQSDRVPYRFSASGMGVLEGRQGMGGYGVLDRQQIEQYAREAVANINDSRERRAAEVGINAVLGRYDSVERMTVGQIEALQDNTSSMREFTNAIGGLSDKLTGAAAGLALKGSENYGIVAGAAADATSRRMRQVHQGPGFAPIGYGMNQLSPSRLEQEEILAMRSLNARSYNARRITTSSAGFIEQIREARRRHYEAKERIWSRGMPDRPILGLANRDTALPETVVRSRSRTQSNVRKISGDGFASKTTASIAAHLDAAAKELRSLGPIIDELDSEDSGYSGKHPGLSGNHGIVGSA